MRAAASMAASGTGLGMTGVDSCRAAFAMAIFSAPVHAFPADAMSSKVALNRSAVSGGTGHVLLERSDMLTIVGVGLTARDAMSESTIMFD
jgi:hypothetical protein